MYNAGLHIVSIGGDALSKKNTGKIEKSAWMGIRIVKLLNQGSKEGSSN
jgi:hypothetical protein